MSLKYDDNTIVAKWHYRHSGNLQRWKTPLRISSQYISSILLNVLIFLKNISCLRQLYHSGNNKESPSIKYVSSSPQKLRGCPSSPSGRDEVERARGVSGWLFQPSRPSQIRARSMRGFPLNTGRNIYAVTIYKITRL